MRQWGAGHPSQNDTENQQGGLKQKKLPTWTESRGSRAKSRVHKFYFCLVGPATRTDLKQTRIEYMTCQK